MFFDALQHCCCVILMFQLPATVNTMFFCEFQMHFVGHNWVWWLHLTHNSICISFMKQFHCFVVDICGACALLHFYGTQPQVGSSQCCTSDCGQNCYLDHASWENWLQPRGKDSPFHVKLFSSPSLWFPFPAFIQLTSPFVLVILGSNMTFFAKNNACVRILQIF